MTEEQFSLLMVILIMVIAFSPREYMKRILRKIFKRKDSLSRDVDDYSFIERPQIVQIRIELTQENIEQHANSTQALADYIWKYNEIKREVDKKSGEKTSSSDLVNEVQQRINHTDDEMDQSNEENGKTEKVKQMKRCYIKQKVGKDIPYELVAPGADFPSHEDIVITESDEVSMEDDELDMDEIAAKQANI